MLGKNERKEFCNVTLSQHAYALNLLTSGSNESSLSEDVTDIVVGKFQILSFPRINLITFPKNLEWFAVSKSAESSASAQDGFRL